ncbi:MAG: hypothetical protein IPL16_11625 [Ignavibacteria bacterium]|nr:hypothetical protein [Ignavibacteria bacterium]
MKKSIKQLYNGMYEKGLNVVEFATALLFIGEITKNEVAKVILFNINDTENEKIISACNAIYLWYYFYNKGKLSKPTFDFINDVCDKIISTRNPGLENYLDLVILFLKKNIIEKSKTKEIKLLTALELLFIETEYENIDLFRLRNQEFQKYRLIKSHLSERALQILLLNYSRNLLREKLKFLIFY